MRTSRQLQDSSPRFQGEAKELCTAPAPSLDKPPSLQQTKQPRSMQFDQAGLHRGCQTATLHADNRTNTHATSTACKTCRQQAEGFQHLPCSPALCFQLLPSAHPRCNCGTAKDKQSRQADSEQHKKVATAKAASTGMLAPSGPIHGRTHPPPNTDPASHFSRKAHNRPHLELAVSTASACQPATHANPHYPVHLRREPHMSTPPSNRHKGWRRDPPCSQQTHSIAPEPDRPLMLGCITVQTSMLCTACDTQRVCKPVRMLAAVLTKKERAVLGDCRQETPSGLQDVMCLKTQSRRKGMSAAPKRSCVAAVDC